ncbi:MAG: flagellar hook-basal body complex protein FliE [Phycisphaerales bacterium]|nr:flagellar hook-basal body complex protein FliE [Phycisphaerales bacterium]
MTDPLGLINGAGATGLPVTRPGGETGSENADFGAVLKAEMARVNELQEAAQVAAEDFAAGRRDDIESVLFAARKADTAFKMLLQVRNKVLEAYEEVKQLRI